MFGGKKLMSEEKKRVELNQKELENVNGGSEVKTTLEPCADYRPVDNKPGSAVACENCRYYSGGKAAECCYPEPVR